jgi:hypothetical protein
VQPTPENNVQLDKIRKTQAELQEVTRLMEENIVATQQRGEMMDHLQVKTGTWHGSGFVQIGFRNSSTLRLVGHDSRVPRIVHRASWSSAVLVTTLMRRFAPNYNSATLQLIRSDNLAVQSKTFRTQAAVVRRQMWWKNFKVSRVARAHLCQYSYTTSVVI